MRAPTADSPLQSLLAPRMVVGGWGGEREGGLNLPLYDQSSRYPVIPVPAEESERQVSSRRTHAETHTHVDFNSGGSGSLRTVGVALNVSLSLSFSRRARVSACVCV